MSTPKPVVVPLRILLGHRSVQTTSRHLAIGGVYVRCTERPQLGTEVRIDLYLPDYPHPEPTRAAVRHLSAEPGEEGFWCEFINLRDSVRKRIAALVTRAMADKGDARAHQRHSANLKVRFGTAREFVIRYAYDISKGGLFVRGQPLPVNSEVKVSLELPDGGPPVEADAVVIRAVTAEVSGVDGMGLQFIGANEEFRARIDAFIERLASEPTWEEAQIEDVASFLPPP